MKKFGLFMILGLMIAVPANAASINQVNYFSLSGNVKVDFESITLVSPIPALPGASGTNFDDILDVGHFSVAERFVGQSVSSSGTSDVLSGSPTNPLSLQAGAPDQNVSVVFLPSETNGNALAGLGPLGFPERFSIGDGALAILFDNDQSEFGFMSPGGDAGSAEFSFFRRDGSLIDSLNPMNLGEDFFGFSRESGTQDIAGISIFNTDFNGIGLDDIIFDVPGDGVPDIPNLPMDPPGTPNVPAPVPEPSTFLLLGSGLIAFTAWRRASNRKPLVE